MAAPSGSGGPGTPPPSGDRGGTGAAPPAVPRHRAAGADVRRCGSRRRSTRRAAGLAVRAATPGPAVRCAVRAPVPAPQAVPQQPLRRDGARRRDRSPPPRVERSVAAPSRLRPRSSVAAARSTGGPRSRSSAGVSRCAPAPAHPARRRRSPRPRRRGRRPAAPRRRPTRSARPARGPQEVAGQVARVERSETRWCGSRAGFRRSTRATRLAAATALRGVQFWRSASRLPSTIFTRSPSFTAGALAIASVCRLPLSSLTVTL